MLETDEEDEPITRRKSARVITFALCLVIIFASKDEKVGLAVGVTNNLTSKFDALVSFWRFIQMFFISS